MPACRFAAAVSPAAFRARSTDSAQIHTAAIISLLFANATASLSGIAHRRDFLRASGAAFRTARRTAASGGREFIAAGFRPPPGIRSCPAAGHLSAWPIPAPPPPGITIGRRNYCAGPRATAARIPAVLQFSRYPTASDLLHSLLLFISTLNFIRSIIPSPPSVAGRARRPSSPASLRHFRLLPLTSRLFQAIPLHASGRFRAPSGPPPFSPPQPLHSCFPHHPAIRSRFVIYSLSLLQ